VPLLVQAFSVLEDGRVSPPMHVTKATLRQRLAFVSSSYPTARPTRGMLKQILMLF
jgi:hypothetical protein